MNYLLLQLYMPRIIVLLFIIVSLQACKHTQPPKQQQPITGILGAFGEEVNLLLNEVEQKKEVKVQQVRFTSGILKGKPVVIAETGVGKVNAAVVTALMLEHFQPRAVIFTGIAGAVNEQLAPGDLVIGTRVAHHDYGKLTADSMVQWPTNNPLIKKENPLYFLSDTGLVTLARTLGKKIVLEKIRRVNGEQAPSIVTGTIVTGDVFVASAPVAQRLRMQLQADATEMEGAAVAQVCWQQGTPFIIIRSISDNANTNAYADAHAFYKIAARNSAHLVMAMVEQLPSF
jgi:adenosylhomocysteine nucleosidase